MIVLHSIILDRCIFFDVLIAKWQIKSVQRLTVYNHSHSSFSCIIYLLTIQYSKAVGKTMPDKSIKCGSLKFSFVLETNLFRL